MNVFKSALIIIASIAVVGCQAKLPPQHSIKATGRISTAKGSGDLVVIFDPPNRFRILGTHPLAGRIFDIGSDGKVTWYVGETNTQYIEGGVLIDDVYEWKPLEKTFVPPKGVK